VTGVQTCALPISQNSSKDKLTFAPDENPSLTKSTASMPIPSPSLGIMNHLFIDKRGGSIKSIHNF